MGLVAEKRFTGHSVTAEDLARIEAAGIGFRILLDLPILYPYHPQHGDPLGLDLDALTGLPAPDLRELAWWAAAEAARHAGADSDPDIVASIARPCLDCECAPSRPPFAAPRRRAPVALACGPAPGNEPRPARRSHRCRLRRSLCRRPPRSESPRRRTGPDRHAQRGMTALGRWRTASHSAGARGDRYSRALQCGDSRQQACPDWGFLVQPGTCSRRLRWPTPPRPFTALSPGAGWHRGSAETRLLGSAEAWPLGTARGQIHLKEHPGGERRELLRRRTLLIARRATNWRTVRRTRRSPPKLDGAAVRLRFAFGPPRT